MADEVVKQWTKQMCELGYKFDCEFDGWGTDPNQSDASLYLSSGGGVIGGGQHHNVNRTAKQFVTLAQTFLDKSTITETTPLPSTDEVKFYLLTNKGVFVGQEQMKNFENNKSSWLKLFEEGNNVITELRKNSER